MLDIGPPPPAIYEKAPSGLFLPKNIEKLAILPGLNPLPSLFAGTDTYGATKVPPWDVPSAQIASWNTAATSGTPVAATGTPVLSQYSEIFVWAASRTSPANDPSATTHVITDNKSGTYSPIGSPQQFNNGASNTIICQLWKRDQRVPAGGLTATTFNMTVTTPGTSPWATGLVFELLNPGNFPLQYAVRNQQVLTATGSFTVPTSGDLFVLDFMAGGGASSTVSGSSGMTQIYNANTFVSGNLRHSAFASGLRAQAANRTYSTTNGGAVTSLSVYFDGPQKTAAKVQCTYQGSRVGPTASGGTTFSAVPIGPAAVDRMVIIEAVLISSNGTFSTFTTTGTALLPLLNAMPGSGGVTCGNYLWMALIPAGTTIDITVTHGSGQTQIYVWTIVGCDMLGPNQVGMTMSNEVTPRLFESSSSNAPVNFTGVNVPKGAIALGGAQSRANTTTLTGSWVTDGSNTVTTAGSVAGHVDNIAGATDLTGLTVGASYSGTVASSEAIAVFGP
jgi:hypothetical protein